MNVAARLEQAAAPATVVVGADTHSRLPPDAVSERLPPLSVKGKAEPLEAYRLHALCTPEGTTDAD